MKTIKVEFFMDLKDESKFDREEFDYLSAAIDHQIDRLIDLESWPSIDNVYSSKYTLYDENGVEITEETEENETK